jgi:predicted RNase H-like nuclease
MLCETLTNSLSKRSSLFSLPCEDNKTKGCNELAIKINKKINTKKIRIIFLFNFIG